MKHNVRIRVKARVCSRGIGRPWVTESNGYLTLHVVRRLGNAWNPQSRGLCAASLANRSSVMVCGRNYLLHRRSVCIDKIECKSHLISSFPMNSPSTPPSPISPPPRTSRHICTCVIVPLDEIKYQMSTTPTCETNQTNVDTKLLVFQREKFLN